MGSAVDIKMMKTGRNFMKMSITGTSFHKMVLMVTMMALTLAGSTSSAWASAAVEAKTTAAVVKNAVAAAPAASIAAAVKKLKSRPQVVFVGAEGTHATVQMYGKTQDNHWQEMLSAKADIGKNGLGKTREGDGKTPVGIFNLKTAFGNKSNPGTILPYTKVTDQYYWVDDVNSRYYNKMIVKNKAKPDWNSGEHIVDYPIRYAYAIVVDYNKDCVKGAGSGIFFHCTANRTTSGCIAIPEAAMVDVLRQIKRGCAMSIDTTANIAAQIKLLTGK